jgi:hypothetical protein
MPSSIEAGMRYAVREHPERAPFFCGFVYFHLLRPYCWIASTRFQSVVYGIL